MKNVPKHGNNTRIRTSHNSEVQAPIMTAYEAIPKGESKNSIISDYLLGSVYCEADRFWWPIQGLAIQKIPHIPTGITQKNYCEENFS